ncbi:tetratricopeptide repeat protein [Streptomyces californicus]
MSAGRDGRIVTFYSYKGGTWAHHGPRQHRLDPRGQRQTLLAVDWDLEAPGRHRFFHPFLDPATLGATTGVIDLITEYAWPPPAPCSAPTTGTATTPASSRTPCR